MKFHKEGYLYFWIEQQKTHRCLSTTTEGEREREYPSSFPYLTFDSLEDGFLTGGVTGGKEGREKQEEEKKILTAGARENLFPSPATPISHLSLFLQPLFLLRPVSE